MKIAFPNCRSCSWSAPPVPASLRSRESTFFPRRSSLPTSAEHSSPTTKMTSLLPEMPSIFCMRSSVSGSHVDAYRNRCNQCAARSSEISDRSGQRISSFRRSHCLRFLGASVSGPQRTSPRPQFGPHVIRNQSQQLRNSLRGLEREGIRHVFKLSSPEEVDAVTIERHPLWNNKKAEHGPFDIIGDVHGCLDELLEFMAQLGYSVNQADEAYSVSSSGDRKLVFVGDLVDRGPGTPKFFASSQAWCSPVKLSASPVIMI